MNKIKVKMMKVKTKRKKSLEAEKKKKPDMNVLIVDFYVYYVLNYLLTFNIEEVPRPGIKCR